MKMKTFVIIAKGNTGLYPSMLRDLLEHGMVPLWLDILSVKEKPKTKVKK